MFQSMKMKVVRKKRRSLVRFLASCVPKFLWDYLIPIPPRMYISTNVIEKILTLRQTSPLDDSSFCSFKSYINNKKQEKVLNSTPKREDTLENAKIIALQKELDEIKKQVAKLMEQQSEMCSDYGTLSNPSEQSPKLVPPPAPPPPPPPLPTFSLIPTNSPIKIEKKKVAPRNGFPCGVELLRDLKKVQLKKVEKSPGGGPIKKPKKTINDPGEFLEAVLKKRFGFVQNSPESSLESVNATDSFNSGTHGNSYEVNKNLKNTVT